jgi:hypothetical protein
VPLGSTIGKGTPRELAGTTTAWDATVPTLISTSSSFSTAILTVDGLLEPVKASVAEHDISDNALKKMDNFFMTQVD